MAAKLPVSFSDVKMDSVKIHPDKELPCTQVLTVVAFTLIFACPNSHLQPKALKFQNSA
jgi:hypothetical protein